MKKDQKRNWFFTVFAATIAVAAGICSVFFFVSAHGDWFAIGAGIALGVFALTSLVSAILDKPEILMLGLVDPW